MAPELTDRQRRILARLIAEYIDQGEPVSSAWLAQHSDLGLSSATVRNILARLEEHGLVRQPHTSAGRVPTDSGYRMYVDALLLSRRRTRVQPDIEARLRRAGTVTDLLENASQELSRVSQHVGFALGVAGNAARLEHIDFVALDGHRVLVIVVGSGGHITHKVVETEERYDVDVLSQAATYINRHFAGLTLHEARAAVALFRMIEEKHRLIELLTQSIEATGLTVVIGSEHLSPDLQPFSIVASTFSDGQRTGSIGVIGPTRMRYQRAIAAVDGMSQLVTKVLEQP